MRVILEVMDVFETKDAAVKCDKQVEALRKSEYGSFASISPTVLPVWTEVLTDVFAYSAYWDYEPQYNQKISRVLVALEKKKLNDLKCFVWFDGSHSVEADALNVTTLAEDREFVSAVVDCIVHNISIRPLGVSFSTTASHGDGVKVVGLNPTGANSTSNFSVCLPPLSLATTPLQIAEFIIYHSHAGVGDFVVYDLGLLPHVKRLVSAVPAMTYTTISLLPWNVPLRIQNVSNIIRVVDCLLRTKGRSQSVLFLELNQFIALYKSTELDGLHRGLKSITDDTKGHHPLVLFHKHYFCDEFSDDIIATSLEIPFVTQRKVRYHRSSEKHSVVLAPPGFSVTLAQAIMSSDQPIARNVLVPERSAVVNVYRECGTLFPVRNTREHYIPDMHMTKFRNLLFASKLYRYLEKQPFAQFLL